MSTAAVHSRDPLRSIARRLFNRRLYGKGAELLDAAAVVAREGWGTWRTLNAPPAPGESRRTTTLRGLRHPIAFRPGTSDVDVIVQTLVRHEYGRLPRQLTPRFVVDAGAYVGDVSLYLLNRYPEARIVALEPDPANFAIARDNLAPYGDRSRILHAGLWSHPTTLRLSGEFTGVQLGGAGASEGLTVPCTDVASILADSGQATIDILKLDIEGAEEAVITERSDAWLPRTRIIVVEYHSPQITEHCTRHLHAHGFTGFRYRSLQYFFNQRVAA